MINRKSSAKPQILPLKPIVPYRDVCLDVQDQSTLSRSAVEFFDLRVARDPNAQAAQLSEQFITSNQSIARLLDLQIHQTFDGREVKLIVRSGNTVGAVPLTSPTTGRFDYCAVVRPRFAWTGLGSMLLQMGWRVAPSPLKLPLLNSSERRVPAWVLSFMILSRLKALLNQLQRTFERVEETLPIPRGTVSWSHYATKSLPAADPLYLLCSFSDLREDRELLGAIHHTVQLQIGVLEGQTQHGSFVQRLIDQALEVKRRVQGFKAVAPSPLMLSGWLRRPMINTILQDGLQAIEWATQNRGLAGLSSLSGLPWNLSMEAFYEAWVETVFVLVARRVGGTIKVGRLRQTVHPIEWSPPSSGSQASLVPDLVMETEEISVLVDAKYKRHLEEMELRRWSETQDEIQEQHRSDLFQALAYAHLANRSTVISCLCYPCSSETWESLKERNRTVRVGSINVGSGSLHLWFAAIPMAVAAQQAAEEIISRLFAIHQP